MSLPRGLHKAPRLIYRPEVLDEYPEPHTFKQLLPTEHLSIEPPWHSGAIISTPCSRIDPTVARYDSLHTYARKILRKWIVPDANNCVKLRNSTQR